MGNDGSTELTYAKGSESIVTRTSTVLARAGWMLALALALGLLATFYRHPIGWGGGALLAVLVVGTAFRPTSGLLVLAALSPFTVLLKTLMRVEPSGIRLIEAMIVAFIAGWCASHVRDGRRPAVPLAFGLAAAVLVSIGLAWSVISAAVGLTELAGPESTRLVGDLLGYYAIHTDAVTAALLFAEGALLTLAVADVCSVSATARSTTLRVMVAAAAVAAALNLQAIAAAAFRAEQPWRELASNLVALRVNVHFADLNAAGSYFAMMATAAVPFALGATPLGVLAAALVLGGVWMSGSRAAIAALALTLCGAGLARIRVGGARRVAITAVVLLFFCAGAFGLWKFSSQRHVATPSMALAIRAGLAKTALKMTADEPVFGVGPGRFFDLSDDYANGPYYEGPRGRIVQENAHNNFLQIVAELGIPGLIAFVVLVGAALRRAPAAGDRESFWIAAAVATFLVSCLAGHPLLVAEAATPFWILVGLAAATGAVPAPPRPVARWMGAAAVVAIAALVPMRLDRALAKANVANTAVGLSKWQREPDGSRWRWAGGQSTFFVPATAHSVWIPLRAGTQGPEEIEVLILLDGRVADRVQLTRGGDWTTIRVPLLRQQSQPFRQIDLEVRAVGGTTPLELTASDSGGVLRVGRERTAER